LKRFKVLATEFNLCNEDGELKCPNAAKLTDEAVDSTEDPQQTTESDGVPWWQEVSEPASWRQLAWSGFYWWASAGENEKIEEEQEVDGLKEMGDYNKNEVERSLVLVGYFQNLTKRIFTTIADIINNENEEDSKDNDDSELVDKTIWIEPADIFEMGLDPYSKQDAEFVVKLIQVWWNRKAQVGSKLSNLCCF
jgi:hypothetical protein